MALTDTELRDLIGKVELQERWKNRLDMVRKELAGLYVARVEGQDLDDTHPCSVNGKPMSKAEFLADLDKRIQENVDSLKRIQVRLVELA